MAMGDDDQTNHHHYTSISLRETENNTNANFNFIRNAFYPHMQSHRQVNIFDIVLFSFGFWDACMPKDSGYEYEMNGMNVMFCFTLLFARSDHQWCKITAKYVIVPVLLCCFWKIYHPVARHVNRVELPRSETKYTYAWPQINNLKWNGLRERKRGK